jgi:iron uptake system component EfeO
MAPIARQMRADVRELRDRTRTTQLNAAQLGNGAKELLDEVATGKVTGEEERYSHLDLLDFEANVEGARRAYLALRPALTADRHVLVNTLDTRFASLRRLLSGYRTAAGWTPYDELSQQQVRELAAAVDALGEPLSQLTAAVVRA